jgi:predicted Zn-dependent peptidase
VPEAIRSCQFPNGLVLVGEQIPALQSAAFTFMVPAGCVHDPPQRGGLAGFTCEMALRGAGPRDSRQYVLDLDNLGVERSEGVGDSHAAYGGATVSDNLFPALEIIADLLLRPHLPEEQLEWGRQVMFQELRSVEDEPSQKLALELRRQFYPAPWGRPPQGQLEALEQITIGEIRRHFETYYRPNGAILGVAGRFDWEALVEHIGRLLGDWEAGPPHPLNEEPTGAGYVHLPYDSQQTQIGIAFASVPYRDPQYFQARGAVGVLSGGMSARLFTEVRERRGLCYGVDASYHSLRERGAVFCFAATSAARAQETLDVVLEELRKLRQGVRLDELQRLQARIKSALVMQQESSSARSAALARDWYHLGHARTLEEIERRIDALTCESINAYLEANPPREFTVATLGPNELEVPFGVS